jgi:uncharacterized protein YoxC
MTKEYKNYRDMKSMKEILQNKSEKITQQGNELSQKVNKLLNYVQAKKK